LDAQVLLTELSQIAETTDSRFNQTYVLTAQAKLFIQQGEFGQAREVAQRINPSWRAPILNKLALLFARKDQPTEAETVLNDIAQGVQDKTDWAEHADALTAMAVVWHNAGYGRGADFLFQKAVEAVQTEQQERPDRIG
jgi:Flp pilus assembly protein TadD